MMRIGQFALPSGKIARQQSFFTYQILTKSNSYFWHAYCYIKGR